MHSFLIAACFVLIVLAPCLAAQTESTLSIQTHPKPKKAARPTNKTSAAQRKYEKRRRIAEEIALEELEDPNSLADTRRRAVLLKCMRVSQLKQMHLSTDGAVVASSKSRAA